MLQSNIAIAAPKAKTGTPATVASDNEIKLWAEVEKDGSAEAYQGYLDEYPNGKYATLAKRRIKPQAPAAAQRQGQASTPNKTNAATSKRPLRPALPLAISEAIWQALETSNNYRYWPPLRSILRVTIRATERSDGGNPTTTSDEREISPVGEKCLIKRDIERRGSEQVIRRTNYSCGGLRLLDQVKANAETNQQDDASSFKIDIEQYNQQGSLFPLQIGAEYSEQETHHLQSNTTYNQSRCRVTHKIPAKQLHPKLTGTAWKVVCENTFQVNSATFNTTLEKHYLEDFGIFTNEIGVLVKNDATHLAIVLPVVGQQLATPLSSSNGRAIIATYEQYDLTIDGK